MASCELEGSRGLRAEAPPVDCRASIEAAIPDLDAERNAPLRRRMTIGWRLGLTASAIVVVVLSCLLAWQQSREVSRWRHDRRELLAESLAPLQSEIEHAGSIDEIRQRLAAYEQAYASGHHPHHRLLLVDAEGQVVALSSDDRSDRLPPRLLQTSVPVTTRLLPGSIGRLIVQQDASLFEAEVAHLRVQGVATIGITVLCLLGGLLLANHLLIARPLAVLVRGVDQMERGYWQKFEVPGGAWELRWLGFRFRRLGTELEATVRRLVEAERKAWLPAAVAEEHTAADLASPEEARSPVRVGSASELRRKLERVCRILETRRAGDHELREIARRAWQHGGAEADRIGDHGLRIRLEDAALRVLHPEQFHRVESALRAMTADRERWAAEREAEIRQVLAAQGVELETLQRRVKHVAGLWRKMQAKGLDVDQVQDVFGFRIIVADTATCYRALRAIHSHFEPQLLRFKDYVACPKANGYRSLHTSVRSSDGPVFEIQIRSRRMDQQAKWGTAAHWQYKRHQGAMSEGAGEAGGWRQLHRSLFGAQSPGSLGWRYEAPRRTELAPDEENEEDGR